MGAWFQTAIQNELKKLNIISTGYFTPINNNFKKFFNQNNFIHDFYINNIIIEYNGAFWHHDIYFDSRFTLDEYKKEILKAKYCIDYPRKNMPNFIIIWESDFKNNLNDIINFIKNALLLLEDIHSTFISSRQNDIILFDQLQY